jgi:hypothetical protein
MAKTSCPTSCSIRARAFVLALAGLAPTAHAQKPPSAPPVADAAAKDEFARAVKLFKAGQAEEALPLFQEVSRATRSPNAHLYVGHCLVRLRRHAEAYRAFAATIKEIGEQPDDKYEPTREAAQAQLSALAPRVARLVLSLADVPHGLAVRVDDAPVEERELGSQLALEPGSHRVDARAQGMAPIERLVNIDGGEVKTITLSFRPVDKGQRGSDIAPPRPSDAARSTAGGPGAGGATRTLGFIAGGVGIAGFAVFTVAGLNAKSVYDELSKECGNGGCTDPAHRDDMSRGKSLQTAANIGLVVGVVGIAASGTLMIISLSQPRATGTSLALAAGAGTVSCRGSF